MWLAQLLSPPARRRVEKETCMKPAHVLTATLCLLAATACTKRSDLSEGMGVNEQPNTKRDQNPATLPSATPQPTTEQLEDPATAPTEDPELPGTTKTPAAIDLK